MKHRHLRWFLLALAGVLAAACLLTILLRRQAQPPPQPAAARLPMPSSPAPGQAQAPAGRGSVASAGFGAGVATSRAPAEAPATKAAARAIEEAAAQAAAEAARRQFEQAQASEQGARMGASASGAAVSPEPPAASTTAGMSGGVYPGATGPAGMGYTPAPDMPMPAAIPPAMPAAVPQSPPAPVPQPMPGAPLPEGAKPVPSESSAAILAQLDRGLPAGQATRGLPVNPPQAATSATPAPVELKRYPAIEAPSRVAPATKFSVMVSLDRSRIAPQTRILQGAATAAGQLKLTLPANAAHQWTINVVLVLPGTLQLAGNGGNTASIVLPEHGDSTPALFSLVAPPPQAGAPAARHEPIQATLWYKGAFLARIERDVTVAAPGAVAAAAAASPAPAAAPAPQPVALDFTQRRADLTLYVMKNSGGNGLTLIVSSVLTAPQEFQVPQPRGLGAWLQAQYALLASRSNRSFGAPAAPESQASAAFLDGFGRQLYRTYAPAPFKRAFWTLERALGSRFRTIEIVTDDPTLPWELMRPMQPGGGKELNFLGLDFDVARVDLSQAPGELLQPPQRETLDRVDVLAPDYSASLPGQRSELAALQAMGARRIAPADLASVRRLLAAPPQGIIHFAGHGGVAESGGATQYGILLRGGVLDLMTLRGLEPLRAPAAHPLVFFNACEVGQASSAPGFVDGWAPELLRDGASGFIGALWAVNDTMAARFSRRFYTLLEQHLAQGADIGEILAQTRRDIYQATGNPTALAYIFYGDPYLTFYRPR